MFDKEPPEELTEEEVKQGQKLFKELQTGIFDHIDILHVDFWSLSMQRLLRIFMNPNILSVNWIRYDYSKIK